ncbi:MAG: 50S ribosomal protein L19e [Candidatus Diapherotrites archaeon]|uniref:50S ribosomal protein L19e n=1 Tax=Candidatus Iainarchaeum sp. TaxID=3101447 RepID=A0A8T3YML3_9ARCH|nr:50S ribosomal protein L19e [Candidatus Diapherotrites archaeon]
MDGKKARRMAAQILKAGETKVWVSPEQAKRVSEAMTKDDIRALIKERIIGKRSVQQHSRGRARTLLAKKAKGRKKGRGKRTGTKAARRGKEYWMKNVRAQRRVFRELRGSGAKFKRPAREIYLMIKGNYFRGKNYISTMVEEAKK